MQIGRPPIVDGARGADPAPGAQNPTARQDAVAAPAVDRADIRPLGIPAVLQILIAEILDAWALPPAAARPEMPLEAAMLIVQTFLQALPAEAAGPHAFLAAHETLVASMERGIERAQAIVLAWNGVPRDAVEALRETRTMVLAAIGEDTPNPTLGPWVMRPQWLEFAPRLELLRRRRRRARRRLLDPDLPLPDVGEEPLR